MFINIFQKELWEDKYQYNGESFKEFCKRISSTIFKNDIDKQKLLYKQLSNFEVLFGGRISANIGTHEEGLTLFNCFILPTPAGSDSLVGIFDLAQKYALTLKSEGGAGFCSNFLRPQNTLIKKIGVTTPGLVKFLELYDISSNIITSGSVDSETAYQGEPTKKSIRKGATMVTISICHPEIINFITAKSMPNKLTKMNMSVLITDAFIYAVDNDLDWNLWYPDIYFEKYDLEWDGDFEKWAEKGYPYVIYNTIKARELWDLLLKNCYNRNEPGVIFIDTVRRFDNLQYLKNTNVNASNPCSEVFDNVGIVKYKGKEYQIGGVCNLGSVNITKFYNIRTGKFDYDKFLNSAQLLVEALDNIIDISNYPLDIYRDASKLKRKVGVGIAGIGSLMMMMDIRYGSEECVQFLDDLGLKFINALYTKSAQLAHEKGVFPLYNSKKIFNGGYIAHGYLTDETLQLIRKYGLRNSALSAIAPNGSLSILAGNISGGIEPVFAREYIRWKRITHKKVDFKYPDVTKNEWFETDYFKFLMVGDEEVLMSIDGKYRVDKNVGLCEQTVVRDYGYELASQYGHTNVATAEELSVDEHLQVLATMAKYVDLSISKTINLPENITFDEFKKVYSSIFSLGVKGCTVYRQGSSVAVLESTKKNIEKDIKQQQEEFLEAFENQKGNGIVKHVKLPDKYPAFGYILRSEGKKWYVHVAFKDKALTKPFAVFVNTNSREDNISTFNTLDKLEELAEAKGLDAELIDGVKNKYSYQKNPVKICRMLGFLLRHNVDIVDIVKAMDSVEQATSGTFVYRLKKFLAQFITEIGDPVLCPNCNTKGLVFQEGCYLCQNCGYTKC